jgi:hypothetical protein
LRFRFYPRSSPLARTRLHRHGSHGKLLRNRTTSAYSVATRYNIIVISLPYNDYIIMILLWYYYDIVMIFLLSKKLENFFWVWLIPLRRLFIQISTETEAIARNLAAYFSTIPRGLYWCTMDAMSVW